MAKSTIETSSYNPWSIEGYYDRLSKESYVRGLLFENFPDVQIREGKWVNF